MKIRISGGSGSGKSYLGKQLAQHLRIPVTHLDRIAYDFSETHRFDTKRPEHEVVKAINNVLKKEDWIIEGGWFTMSKESYDQAELLIYLNPPFWKRLWNTLKRFFARIREGKYEGAGNYVELTLYNMRSVKKWQYDRPRLFKNLYPKTYHAFGSADEAYAWILKNG